MGFSEGILNMRDCDSKEECPCRQSEMPMIALEEIQEYVRTGKIICPLCRREKDVPDSNPLWLRVVNKEYERLKLNPPKMPQGIAA